MTPRMLAAFSLAVGVIVAGISGWLYVTEYMPPRQTEFVFKAPESPSTPLPPKVTVEPASFTKAMLLGGKEAVNDSKTTQRPAVTRCQPTPRRCGLLRRRCR